MFLLVSKLQPFSESDDMFEEEEDEDTLPLSAEQEDILKLVLSGKSIFFTGCAGTGKSYLLLQIKKALRRKFGHLYPDKVAVTAPTGLTLTISFNSTDTQQELLPSTLEDKLYTPWQA